MYKPAVRTKVSEEVVNQIINIIKSGEWALGEKIPGEMELAKNFEVSRNSIREAVKALEISGILYSKAGSGTYLYDSAIRTINYMEQIRLFRGDNSLLELMESRMVIEAQLAYMAAERADHEDLNAIESAINLAVEAFNNDSYHIGIGHEFHMAVAKAARNKILYGFLDSLANEIMTQRRVLYLAHSSKKQLIHELEEHKRIFSFIKQGSAGQARDLMHKHIKNAIKIISEQGAARP